MVILWQTKDFTGKGRKSTRLNVDLDHVLKLRWSPDSKAFVGLRYHEKDLLVYRVIKKEGDNVHMEPISSFPIVFKDVPIGLAIASTGLFMMIATRASIQLWNLKGGVMDTIAIPNTTLHCVVLSPCDRFIGTAGRSKEVDIWSVKFDGVLFKGTSKLFKLKGHSSDVLRIVFSDDGSRMVSLSKDNTWKLWDLQATTEDGTVEPCVLHTVKCNVQMPCHLSLTFDARVLAIAVGPNVILYSLVSGQQEEVINMDGTVNCIAFDALGRHLLVAVWNGVRVFHNVVGYRVKIEDLKRALKKATSELTRERIWQQINEAQSALDAMQQS